MVWTLKVLPTQPSPWMAFKMDYLKIRTGGQLGPLPAWSSPRESGCRERLCVLGL
jgi:hypothetical protein